MGAACCPPRETSVQESNSMEWGLWDGPICIMEPSKGELSLNTIWDRFEEFCKPQSNEVRAHFDLLTRFWLGNHSVDKWYNTLQAQVDLAKYLLETAKILQCDIFWFFTKDEDCVSKTIH